MNIAVLSWSPLASDPAWQRDGPTLPIEFAKKGRSGPLIPVLSGEVWVGEVRVLWALSPFHDFDSACRDFAVREGVPVPEIGSVHLGVRDAHDAQLHSLPDGSPKDAILARLRQWGQAHQVDVIIWRDSRADLFLQAQTVEDAKAGAEEYLTNLTKDELAAAALYTQQVPLQVWTPLRDVFVSWLPSNPIKNTNELRFEDWQECRRTIGRLDTILEDLRKIGFSLITGLLTAGAFLNFLGIPTAQKVPAPPSEVRAAVFIVIMVLVAALFSVDTYYQVLLSRAAERALDLEVQTNPPIRITKYISVNATKSGISYILLALYLVLLATAEGLGLLAAGGMGPTFSWPPAAWLLVWLIGPLAFLTSVWVIIVAYQRGPPPDRQPVIIGTVVPFVTLGLGVVLLAHVPPDPTQVRYWMVATGMFLAIYVQYYWLYTAWRSGLYRQKPERTWPEGDEKGPV